MNFKTPALFLCLAAVISGCAMDTPPYSTGEYTVVGGAAGAGTGVAVAEIASSFLPGAIGAGAVVGGLIGLPIGAVIGYEIADSANHSDLALANQEVDSNASLIAQRNGEITRLRSEIETDEITSDTDDVDPKNSKLLYNGPQR